MSAVCALVDLLAGRRVAADVAPGAWPAIISVARAEVLAATLAQKLVGEAALPPAVAAIFADLAAAHAVQQRQSLWEAEMARRALAPAGVRFVLLKGTAYAAAGLAAAAGRQIGDLDILVARADLDRAEAALLAAGWEWVKTDAYDDAYYRQHMHELPPLIHRERDRMIDVHHSILPLTHRAAPDAALLLARAVPVADGHQMLGDADIAIHCAAHVMADGDLAGGLRNLWDFHLLTTEMAAHGDGDYAAALRRDAAHHGLLAAVARAARLAHHLYGRRDGGDPALGFALRLTPVDRLFLRALLARDDWGRRVRPLTRLCFYIRSHWLRMPPRLLAQHLWVKARRGQAAAK